MRTIDKSPEPAPLAEHRARGREYGRLKKAAIRPTLVRDQRGLCCYCMCRIRNNRKKVKIEHFLPQSRYPDLALTWDNLFAACLGGTGRPPSQQHCDTSKGAKHCDLDPRLIREEDFSYRSDGTIVHADPELDRQLNEVLQLNTPMLRQHRRATLSAFIEAMSRRSEGSWSRGALERELQRRLSRERLDPYCMVVVGWLRRRLRKR